MRILALDLSTRTRSAAVLDTAAPGAGRATTWAHPQELAHPTTLVDRALKAAACSRESIDRLAVGLGPGSYTGIRMALALAQGWQLARSIEVAGISSALCLAHQMKELGHLGPVQIAVDAQRQEFCLAGFLITTTGVSEATPLVLVSAAELAAKVLAGQTVAGPELGGRFPGALEMVPDAAKLAQLAACVVAGAAAEDLRPIYVRAAQYVPAKPRLPPRRPC